MTKKIVYQKRFATYFWMGEYLKWECGCSEIMFSDRGSAFSRKFCGNEHEKVETADQRNKSVPSA